MQTAVKERKEENASDPRKIFLRGGGGGGGREWERQRAGVLDIFRRITLNNFYSPCFLDPHLEPVSQRSQTVFSPGKVLFIQGVLSMLTSRFLATEYLKMA